MNPGRVGITISDDGQIVTVDKDAQQSLKDAGISTGGNWKITKVCQVYTKHLLNTYINGDKNYILQLERRNVTVIINFCTFLLF